MKWVALVVVLAALMLASGAVGALFSSRELPAKTYTFKDSNDNDYGVQVVRIPGVGICVYAVAGYGTALWCRR